MVDVAAIFDEVFGPGDQGQGLPEKKCVCVFLCLAILSHWRDWITQTQKTMTPNTFLKKMCLRMVTNVFGISLKTMGLLAQSTKTQKHTQ